MIETTLTQEWVLFVLNITGTAVGLLFVLTLWVWPALKRRRFAEAVLPLLIFNIFRAIGAGFLIPGIVSEELPAGFATPTAVGDLIAAGLAAVAALAVARGWSWAVASVWVVNIVGLLDLLNAFAQVGIHGAEPGQLQTMYLVVTVNVPTLLVTHAIIFALLLRRSREPAPATS